MPRICYPKPKIRAIRVIPQIRDSKTMIVELIILIPYSSHLKAIQNMNCHWL